MIPLYASLDKHREKKLKTKRFWAKKADLKTNLTFMRNFVKSALYIIHTYHKKTINKFMIIESELM